MPTVVLRPDAQHGPSGLFKDESNSSWTVTKINDSSNSTYIYNAAANQDFTVTMDNTSGLSGATFNNFVVTAIFQKHSAKGASAKFAVEIGDSSGTTTFGSISDTVFVTTNASPTTINATAINFGVSIGSSEVDDMRVKITTTNLTQVRLFDLEVRVDYTAAASGYGNNVNGVASANIAKVDGVETANIEKVIGV